jgi:hypothetical protein
MAQMRRDLQLLERLHVIDYSLLLVRNGDVPRLPAAWIVKKLGHAFVCACLHAVGCSMAVVVVVVRQQSCV